MKKIIAVTVLLALLSFAVFAQDGSGWKIGFSAQFIQDFLYTTKATGEYKHEPVSGSSTTKELGKYNEGQTEVFGFTDISGYDHNRLLLKISNDGEHHHVYLDLAYDDSWSSGQWCNASFIDFLNSSPADWYFAGDTGASGSKVVLDGKVGTGRYDGFVNRIDIWDDYIGGGDQNFFGVYKITSGNSFGLLPSDTIGAADFYVDDPWSRVFAIGVTYDNQYRLAFGTTLSNLRNNSSGLGDSSNAYASKSETEFSVILSGRPVDLLNFDVFYALNGGDNNTAARDDGNAGTFTYGSGSRNSGEWQNIIGVYAGLDLGSVGISGLGVSAGYTANFTAYEKQAYFDTSNNDKEYAFDKTGPVYSGIDLNVSYNGIDKLGISLKNNISFASAEYKYKDKPDDTEVLPLFSSYGTPNGAAKDYSETQNFFAYRARLAVSYGLTDNVKVTLALQDKLGLLTKESKDKVGSSTIEKTDKTTMNSFITSLHADYGVGNVSFGLGLTLKVDTTSIETTTKGSTGTDKVTGTLNVTTFHVPLVFKVSI